NVRAISAAQDDDLRVFVGEESGQCAVVLRRHVIVFVALANLGARIDNVEESGFEVVAFVRRQVGADLATLTEKFVARRAGAAEELASFIRITGPTANGGRV